MCCVVGSGSDSGLLCHAHSACRLKLKQSSWERQLLIGAMDQEDVPVAVLPQPKPKRLSGKRPPTSRLPRGRVPVLSDGPPVLVAIIGERGGRWSPSHCEVEPVLQRAWQSRGVLTTGPSLESPLVLGFAVVRAWHFITVLEDPTVHALFTTCRKSEAGRRGVAGALLHSVLAACALVEPLPAPWPTVDVLAADSEVLGARARQAAASAVINVFNECGVIGTYNGLSAVLRRWLLCGLATEARRGSGRQ